MKKNQKEKSDEIKNKTQEIEPIIKQQADADVSTEKTEGSEFENITEEEKPDNVNEEIKKINNFIDSIKGEVDLRNKRDEYKDEAICRMSKQIADFEKGVFEKIKKELINEIISFYDLLLNFQRKFKNIDNKELQNEIDFLETEVSNILFNNSIDEIDENIGSEINRDFHKIKKKIETDDIEENQKIKQILKKGFSWNDKVLRKQEVIITEFKEKDNTNE